MTTAYPGDRRRLEQQVPELGAGRPGEMGAGRLRDRAGRFARRRPLARLSSTCWSPREAQGPATTASNGPARSPGATARSASTASPTTRMNQWHVAPLRPPHLAALCVWEGSSDYYRELARHGGILCDFLAQLVRAPGRQRAARRRRARRRRAGHRRAGRRARRRCRRRSSRKNRADVAGDALRRRLIDDYYRARTPRLREDRRAAAVGRQLGRPGPASARQLRRLSARRLQAEMARGARRHALLALLHRTTATTCRSASSAISSKARTPAGTSSRRSRSTSATRARNSRCAPRTNGRSRARSGRSSISSRTTAACAGRADGAATTLAYETTGDGLTFLTPPMTRGDGDHRAGRRQAVRVVRHHRRRHVPGAARVRSARQGSDLHRRQRSAHADRPRLAARLAPQARSRSAPCPIGPGTPTTRNAAAHAGRAGRARRRDLADLHRRAARLSPRPHGARQGLRVRRHRRRRSRTRPIR